MQNKNKLFSLSLMLSIYNIPQNIFAFSEKAKEIDTRPNFIFIFCDDLGYGDLGCYGNPTIHTPNIDRMAAEGMKLTQFYVGASVSTPSRSSLMTGRLPVRNGMYGDKQGVLFPDSEAGLGQDEITIAKLLQQHGYATACIGKWHLGHSSPYLPLDHGFDDFFGVPYSNDMSPLNPWDRAQTFPPTPLIHGNKKIEDEPFQGELTRRYTEFAINYINEHAAEPFFLYLAHTFPHTPLYTNDRFRGKSKRGLYGDVVEELDWSVGEILNTLKKMGLEKNTLVVFSSDNGPWLSKGLHGGSSGPLRQGKGTWWEGGFRVPAIFRMIDKIAPRTEYGIMATVDIFPTFLAMAQIPIPKELILDGIDQSAMLLEKSPSARNEMFYWKGSTLQAVRKGPWKIHFRTLSDPYTDPKWEHPETPFLYNVEKDVGEQFEVSAKYPRVVRELMELAEKHQKGMIIKSSVCDLGF